MFFFGWPQGWRALRKTGFNVSSAVAVMAWVAAAAMFHPVDAFAREALSPAPAVGEVDLAALPPEAQGTYRLIRQGGPFPGRKDGVVFGNRERLLPSERRGFYREYTVPTPGARDRGAKRIVCGGAVRTAPRACFYTADHYASFRRIAP